MNNTNEKAEAAIFALLKDGFDLEQIKAAYEHGEYLVSIGEAKFFGLASINGEITIALINNEPHETQIIEFED